jgi:hypothetical protein
MWKAALGTGPVGVCAGAAPIGAGFAAAVFRHIAIHLRKIHRRIDRGLRKEVTMPDP